MIYLYHGPKARPVALSRAPGRAVHDPMGEDGLKVDEAREAASLLSTIPVGDMGGHLLLGPLDRAHERSSDALLKVLEDRKPEWTTPVLWAHSLEDVRETIRSRSVAVWCPGDDGDRPHYDDAHSLYEYYKDGDLWNVIQVLKSSDMVPVLNEFLGIISSLQPAEKRLLKLWSRLRPVMAHDRVLHTEVVAVLASEMEKRL